MDFIRENREFIDKLYAISNPIIKFRIDKEILSKDNITIKDYVSEDNLTINYWLSILNSHKIHGREDVAFENCISKLLDFGFKKDSSKIDFIIQEILSNYDWTPTRSFEKDIMTTVISPFLIRLGYYSNSKVKKHFIERLLMVETTVIKYGHNIQKLSSDLPKKFLNSFIFKINGANEALPTIYDLYSYAFVPKNKDNLDHRIESIVNYILEDDFQNIPSKSYIYDEVKKQYYAAGNVYHSCIIEERKLLITYLLSHFKNSTKSKRFMKIVNEFISTKSEDGLFDLDKTLIKEKKDSYQMYSGSHMGLGENRRSKKWKKIESSFWVLLIMFNLSKNGVSIKLYSSLTLYF